MRLFTYKPREEFSTQPAVQNEKPLLEADVLPGQYVTLADSSIRHVGAMGLKISFLDQDGLLGGS